MPVRILSLHVFPIKSCAGIALDASVIDTAGLAMDRRWLLVDATGAQMTQRAYPRMALIQPAFVDTDLRLQAPGHEPFDLSVEAGLDAPHQEVTVWRARIRAHPVGVLADAWFSAVMGVPCALFRVAEPMHRQPDPHYVEPWVDTFGTGPGQDHAFGFADGFPLLVASQASLGELNEHLQAKGHGPVSMDRFRPNIVVDGLEPFDEDHIAWISFNGITLGLVKPCTRCSMPDVDPRTGVAGTEPGDTLATFRTFDAGVLFGQNAIVAAGAGGLLAVGDEGEFEYRF